MRKFFGLLALGLTLLYSGAAFADNTALKLGQLVWLQQSVTSATTTGTGRLLSFNSDVKSFNATITGSGALTGTVLLQSSHDGSVWETRNTFTLSGTNADSVTWETANNAPLWRTSVTAISGTGASINTSAAGRR